MAIIFFQLSAICLFFSCIVSMWQVLIHADFAPRTQWTEQWQEKKRKLKISGHEVEVLIDKVRSRCSKLKATNKL